MTVVELEQGHYRDLTGTPKDDALVMFARDAEAFLEKHPDCRKYHRPCWRERDVPDQQTAPWGHEWYEVTAEGTLQWHSAFYDSSD